MRALCIARVFHGVATKPFPRQNFKDVPWWKRHSDLPLPVITNLVMEALSK